jgi:hypothetical protein
VQSGQLNKQTVVYIRQSTVKQVQQNQESTRRQYQLAERAHEMGWPQPLIRIIDDDLGLSGASSDHRLGCQKLVAALSLDEVGIIFVTEVSRVSRLNSKATLHVQHQRPPFGALAHQAMMPKDAPLGQSEELYLGPFGDFTLGRDTARGRGRGAPTQGAG